MAVGLKTDSLSSPYPHSLSVKVLVVKCTNAYCSISCQANWRSVGIGNIGAGGLTVFWKTENENNKLRLTNPQNKIIKLIVGKELTFGFGAVIADINKMGNGFLVKNCNFSYNRSRGILIKASNGNVIGNTLQENWMSSVLISPEAWWLESGSSDNVEVSNNIILDNKQNKAINITGEGFDGEIAPAGLHKNINITNNQFVNCLFPVIYIASTKDGNITGNKITKPAISNLSVQNSTHTMLINCENIMTK